MLVSISFLATIGVYLTAKLLYRRVPVSCFSPLITCPMILILLLLVCKISYTTYAEGNQLLSAMLQPATVALAYPVYKYLHLARKHAIEIFFSVLSGAILAIISSMTYARLFHLSPKLIGSMAPRSITTPIAVDLSRSLGGIPTMTAVFVILTGITGLIISPLILKYLPIDTKVAKGLLLGIGAHGAGTAKAYEIGSVEGSVATLAMVFTAIISIGIAPFLVPSFLHMLTGA
jgi:predicted murein hydrolase (TIGR00659 family)